MHKLFDIAPIICIVLMSIIMQETEAQNCSTQHIESCTAAYYSTLRESTGDKEAICSVVNIYLECLQTNNSDCSLEAGQAIANAKTSLHQYHCEAEARNCATPRIQSCVSALESAISQAGEDKEKRCSDGYIYLECVTKVGTYCDLDVGQALMEVNKMLSQDGCVNDSGNGAGSIIFTFFVMCFKLTLYKLV